MNQIKTVIITGAGSGLGRAFAQKYAKEGYALCLTDINDAGLAETVNILNTLSSSKVSVWTYSMDVRSQDDWNALHEKVVEHWGRLDVLINNAGVAHMDRIGHGDWKDWQWALDINLNGVMLGCFTFASMMKKQQSGAILNIASQAGLFNPPSMTAYSAGKAAVISISDSLYMELKPYGIHVSALCPNFFNTNLSSGMRSSDSKAISRGKRLMEKGEFTPEQMAMIGYDSLVNKKRISVPGRAGKVALFMKRFMPFVLYRKMNQMAEYLKEDESSI